MEDSTHYSLALEIDKLVKVAKRLANKLNKIFKEDGVNHICLNYMGMSGVSHATALATALQAINPKLKVSMRYVRKAGEDAHGIHIEHYFCDDSYPHHIFVDDFIEEGNTFNAVSNDLECFYGVVLFDHLWQQKNIVKKYFNEKFENMSKSEIKAIKHFLLQADLDLDEDIVHLTTKYFVKNSNENEEAYDNEIGF